MSANMAQPDVGEQRVLGVGLHVADGLPPLVAQPEERVNSPQVARADHGHSGQHDGGAATVAARRRRSELGRGRPPRLGGDADREPTMPALERRTKPIAPATPAARGAPGARGRGRRGADRAPRRPRPRAREVVGPEDDGWRKPGASRPRRRREELESEAAAALQSTRQTGRRQIPVPRRAGARRSESAYSANLKGSEVRLHA